jgi:hypothetical protein
VARKLLCLGALITLVSLAQVAPGRASMYAFSGGNGTIGIWTKVQGTDQDHTRITINIVYDTFTTGGKIRFSVNLADFTIGSLSDFELISTTKYSMATEGGLVRASWEEILYGTGHGRGNASFSFTANLTEIVEDGNHYGFMTSFSFSSSYADPLPSSVPLPGAVWFLGSGLAGLACLRPCLRT